MILSAVAELTYIPQRIVSLVPSQTELLYTLGLEAETIGITKFCVHPKTWFHTKTRIGGTKTVNTELVAQLQPDLIIANKEENVKEQVIALAKDHPVWVTDINNAEEALQMITTIGQLTHTQNKSDALVKEIQQQFQRLQPPTINSKPKTAYLIWRKPYMAAGGNTFIHDMLGKCGFQNIFAQHARYPEIAIEQLKAGGCQLLLLSSEPYPFKQQHIDELQQQLPHCKIVLADGEMFSWYGSRMLHAAAYFKELINTYAF